MNYYRLANTSNQRHAYRVSHYDIGVSGIGSGILDKMVPNRVKREMDLVNSDMKAADTELIAVANNQHPQLKEFYIGPWSAFMEKWRGFYRGNSGWGDRFMSGPSIYDRVQEFRNDLLQYRNKATGEGMVWGSPDPLGARPDDYIPGPELPDLFDFSKKVIIGLAIFAGIIVIILVFQGRSPAAFIPGKGALP